MNDTLLDYLARTDECSVDGCGRPIHSRSLCGGHYRRLLDGRPIEGPLRSTLRGQPVEQRLWSRVDKSGNCWIWTGPTDGKGYGTIGFGGRGRNVYVHRLAYELIVAPIPEGLQIDHLCRVPLCVRPDHLEAVTQRENILRGTAPSAVNARKTHCVNGHRYTPETTITAPDGRRCRVCKQERDRRLYWERNPAPGVRRCLACHAEIAEGRRRDTKYCGQDCQNAARPGRGAA